MKAFSVAIMLVLVLFAAGCTNYKTKFNRGYYEIPGDFKKIVKEDVERFNTLDQDIHRRVAASYEKTVDGVYDVKRWTTQEWNQLTENVEWTVVQIGKEFNTIRDACSYVQRRWSEFGPKVKGIWTDTYRYISYELAVTNELDSETKRYWRQEFERMSTAGDGMKRWVRNRQEEAAGLSEFIRRMYSRETEKGSETLTNIKDYFTKRID